MNVGEQTEKHYTSAGSNGICCLETQIFSYFKQETQGYLKPCLQHPDLKLTC